MTLQALCQRDENSVGVDCKQKHRGFFMPFFLPGSFFFYLFGVEFRFVDQTLVGNSKFLQVNSVDSAGCVGETLCVKLKTVFVSALSLPYTRRLIPPVSAFLLTLGVGT